MQFFHFHPLFAYIQMPFLIYMFSNFRSWKFRLTYSVQLSENTVLQESFEFFKNLQLSNKHKTPW